MKHERCKSLFGEDFSKLQNANIIILGVGGVGGHALDCLYRSGVENITIVDFDNYDESNQNRQIGSENIGAVKVEHLQSLYPNIKTINTRIDVQWVKENDLSSYDLILDAIDDIYPKIELIKKYYKKLISTSGSAKRIDPTKIEYISIWKTYNDPFIRKIRNYLKKDNFKAKFKVIFSGENPQCKDKGSFVGVTGSFGLAMCSIAINKILSK
ncbi:MAG TPA: tRNA threonylcarbamoyladenosine dehydratase [Arcobacter sp.]|nr:tRNA threonylcarbamoyladenosine dehydratase [Arcobacter sp.]